MRFAKPIVVVLLATALASYAIDCGAATTQAEAMQCCESMQCSSQGHQGMDCCETMPTLHAPFVQSAQVHGISLSAAAFATMPAAKQPIGLEFFGRTSTARSHAPPAFDTNVPKPLRI